MQAWEEKYYERQPRMYFFRQIPVLFYRDSLLIRAAKGSLLVCPATAPALAQISLFRTSCPEIAGTLQNTKKY